MVTTTAHGGQGSVRRMLRWAWLSSLVLSLCILPLGAEGASTQATTATVRTDPVVAVARDGGTTTVNLYVQDVQNLYGVDIRVSFDPTILEVQDADPSAAGVQIQPLNSFLQPDFVVKKLACNTMDPANPDCAVAGTIWYAATQVNPSLPATGSGPVAAIVFKRLGPGTTTVTITHSELSDRHGVVIPATAQNGSVTVPSSNVYLPLILKQ